MVYELMLLRLRLLLAAIEFSRKANLYRELADDISDDE